MSSAKQFLEDAIASQDDRAAERDSHTERSMVATVNAFNALYDKNLTEVEGWMFMVMLKAARAKGGELRVDDYIDGASYFALAGEAAYERSS